MLSYLNVKLIFPSLSENPCAGDIRTTMIIAAALVEGVALFALVICFILQGK